MKKLGILFFIFFNLCLCANARVVKFIQVTDIHMTQSSANKLNNFIKEVNTKHRDIDFVVFSGDNINRPNQEDLELFLRKIKPLKAKKYVLVGNHDLYKHRHMPNETYMKTVHKHLGMYHSDKPNYVFKQGKLVFVTMNGVKEVIPGPNGFYRHGELEWLDKTLSEYPNNKVVIIQHFPLVDSKVEGHNLYKKEDYLEVLKKHNNVIAIVSGHYHKNIEVQDYGVYNIVTKNFGSNGCYKIIEIDDEDGFISTTLVEMNNK